MNINPGFLARVESSLTNALSTSLGVNLKPVNKKDAESISVLNELRKELGIKILVPSLPSESPTLVELDKH